jgi:Uma2 family endonuclease
MAELAEKFATYEDLLNVPEHLVAEILNNHLETHPRPSPKHANTSSSLGIEIGSPFHRGHGGPGGWWILDEPELHLGGNVMVPDLAGWRRERMPELPDTAWFELPPDWVCEILSPSTARIDRVVKMPMYAEYGVQHLWLIDPLLQTLEAYELNNKQWTLIKAISEDSPASIPPFDAIEFPLESLWA